LGIGIREGQSMLMTTGGEKITALVSLASSVQSIDGDVAECGVFQGGSLRLLATALPNKRVIGFDTFAGLPAEAWTDGEPHAIGDFSQSSLNLVRENTADLPNVELVAGVFPGSARQHNDASFAFVYLDFDYYLSTRNAIAWFLPRMSSGGIIVFDDVGWRRCPGVQRAIDEAGLSVESSAPYQAYYRVPKEPS
jgi:predicted O-methyltransferase YrrM